VAESNVRKAERTILVTRSDEQRLRRILASKGSLDGKQNLRDLLMELDRAQVVEDDEIPADVITMNTRFELRDLDTGFVAEYTLVYPGEADFTRGKISVLAPIGTALLGYRELDTVEWQVPAGIRRLRIESVLYQPQAARAEAA